MDSAEKLLANSFKSLSPGGLIAVFDAHLNQFKKGPLSVAEYSCLLMHSTEGNILTSAGFIHIEVIDVAADRTLITGKKDDFS